MELNALMREAFSTCFVSDKKIMFLNQYSKEDINRIYQQFSKDLLGCNIPHWRVVGFWHGWDDHHQQSAFRNNDFYGMSLIELSRKLRFVIPENNGGNSFEKGCFYGWDEEEPAKWNMEAKAFNEAFGDSEKMRVEENRANILKYPKEIMGSLMIQREAAGTLETNDEITTSNMFYTQFTKVDMPKYPNMLLPNVKICDFHDQLMDRDILMPFILEGTGRHTYEENQKLFRSRRNLITPCATNYDLSEFFTCAMPTEDNYLTLVYRGFNINESVLTTILNRYGGRFVL